MNINRKASRANIIAGTRIPVATFAPVEKPVGGCVTVESAEIGVLVIDVVEDVRDYEFDTAVVVLARLEVLVDESGRSVLCHRSPTIGAHT
nr:hypothetical protein CFP56_76477 [Quercus suber]